MQTEKRASVRTKEIESKTNVVASVEFVVRAALHDSVEDDFVHSIARIIVEPENRGEEDAGGISASLVQFGEALDHGISAERLGDGISGDISEYWEHLFDAETGYPKQEIQNEFEVVDLDLLIIDYVAMYPAFRGLLDSAMLHIGKTAQEASQSLSIGAPPLVAANILPQAIKEFRVHRPELRIQLSDGTLTAILEGVQAGKLDVGLGIFGKAPDIRRTPFFRFSLMVIRPDADPTLRRASTTWSALKRERLLVMTNTSPLQQFINKHLAKAGVVPQANTLIGSLDLQIAMVEAGEGVAVIPSFGLPACRNRRVMMSRLINPEVTLDFYQIRNRGKKIPSGAEDFTSFLQAYIARWAGRAGIL